MSDTKPRPGVADLFLGFFLVGIMGFGGVLASARRMVVERRRWMTAAEFTDLLGLCQFLPGGNIMNLSVALGGRFRGVPGAAAAFLGLMSGPVIVVIALGAVYDQARELQAVRGAFAFVSAAAAAFMLATALRIAAPLRHRPLGVVIAMATFGSLMVFGWPLVIALPVMAAISVAVSWRSTP
jgi:chromate transporter